MDTVFGLVSLSLIFFNSVQVARWWNSRFLAESLLAGYLAAVIQVIGFGYLLSACDSLASPLGWAIAACGLAPVLYVVLSKFSLGDLEPSEDSVFDADTTKDDVGAQRWWSERAVIGILALTVAVVAMTNLGVVLLTVPHNYDSHSCHLARTAHFLQQGNLDWYPTNMWGQVVHPRHHPILLSYTYLVGGEKFTQTINYTAWLFLGLGVFSVVARLSRNRASAVISGLVSMILINAVMVSTTTQNDLLIAVQMAIVVYALVTYMATGGVRYLWATALPLFVCFGIKGSTLLALPSLLVIAAFAIFVQSRKSSRSMLLPSANLCGAILLAVLLALPTGYLDNLIRDGHPLGPVSVRKMHTLDDLSPSERLSETGKNVLRLGLDSTIPDGLQADGLISEGYRKVMRKIKSGLEGLGVQLEDAQFSRVPFGFDRPYRSHEDFSFWGVLSVLLIWPAVLFSCLAFWRNKSGFVFSLATILFLFAQAYAQYDPWRGRYFVWAIVFAVPPVAMLLPYLLSSRLKSGLLMASLCLACFAVVQATVYRTNSNLVDSYGITSVFKQDRYDQMARNNPGMAQVMRDFEQAVPADASVGLALPKECYVFPFYGTELNHKVSYLPLEPNGWRDAEANADVLVYQRAEQLEPLAATDTQLGPVVAGANFYLRKCK